MSPVILFGLLLIVSFVVAAYLLKPSREETDIQRHIAGLNRGTGLEGGTILREEMLSNSRALSEFLRQLPGSYALQRLIKQAGSRWKVAPLLFGSLAAGLLAGWIASFWISNDLLCICLGVLVIFLPCLYLYVRRAARFRRFSDMLPEAIDLMARALRVGHSVVSVLEMVGQEVAEPVASEFRTAYEEQSLGLPLREAMLNLTQRVPIPDIRFLATAVVLQKETGGNLAEILDKTAMLIRERQRLRGQLRVYTAQGRATGWVLCALPFVVFFGISLVNPSYERVLFTDPTGRHLVMAGLALLVIGIFIIQKIVDIRV
jgi:tight adherence protein B